MTDEETVTITLESADGATDDLEVPTGLLDLLAEEGDTAPDVVGDIAMLGFAQRIHGAVAHGQGEPSEELRSIESATMDLFEDRFGRTFAELTGHDH